MTVVVIVITILAALAVGIAAALAANATILKAAPDWMGIEGGAKPFIAIGVVKSVAVAATAYALSHYWTNERFAVWLTAGIVCLLPLFTGAVNTQQRGEAAGDKERGGQAMAGFWVATVIYVALYYALDAF